MQTDQLDNIPQEMRTYQSWVCWRFEDTTSLKPTKVPYSAINGKLASVNDPSTWTTFDKAVQVLRTSNWYDGIGFVLTENDPFAFIDLDDTKGDKKTLDRQIKIYQQFDSYAEKSPSGSGLHIIVNGGLPSGRRRGSIEIYSTGRYMTMTGDVYRNAPINECNAMLNVLYDQMSSGSKATAIYVGATEETITDDQVFSMAESAANGAKFTDLWRGEWEAMYASQSEADFALVDILAYYTQHRPQIIRMFRESGLGKRDKAQREDYMAYMLNRCFDNMLPPVDTEQLQNQLQEAIEKKQKEELQKASLVNDAPVVKIEHKEVELHPQKDIYSAPPGLVGEIAKFIYAQAPRPVPEIALAGALGMMAGIAGRAYNVSGTGLNQYMLLLAPTGTGKESIASGIDKLFNCVTAGGIQAAEEFIGPAEIASSQAVIKYMSKGPVSFTSIVGEFGFYMQQMANVNAPPHLKGLQRFILDAYNKSGEGKVLRPSIYSDKDKNTHAVRSPAFSLLGESTPEKFYEGMHEGLIADGLLPRFTIIEYRGKRPPPNKHFRQAQPSFELIDKLSTLCSHALMLNSQDKAIHVGFTPEAQLIFDNFDKHCDDQINGSDREVRRQLWNRAHIKAMKLAAIVAVGCNQYDPIIDVVSANWAINIIVADCKNILTRFNSGEIGIDNEESQQMAEIIKQIKTYIEEPWPNIETYLGEGFSQLHTARIIPYTYIHRKVNCTAVFKKDRQGSTTAIKRTLQTLIERGDIQEVGRSVMVKDYNKTCKAYMISHLKAFEL